MIKNFTMLLLALFIANTLHSQTVLLEKDLQESVYVKKKGPNKPHFFHLYYNIETFANNSSLYKAGYSMRNYIGIRNNYKVTDSYNMGFDLEYGWENFRINQNADKTFPNSIIHKKEVLSTFNVGLVYFNRFQLTQKEGSFGWWIDAGTYGNLTLNSRHVTKDEATGVNADARQHKEINKGLNYVNPWEYGLKGRLGYKRYALTATYRLSDWITKDELNAEPPQLSIGLELGFY